MSVQGWRGFNIGRVFADNILRDGFAQILGLCRLLDLFFEITLFKSLWSPWTRIGRSDQRQNHRQEDQAMANPLFEG